MHLLRIIPILFALLLPLAACGGGGDGTTDAGGLDGATTPDATVLDAGGDTDGGLDLDGGGDVDGEVAPTCSFVGLPAGDESIDIDFGGMTRTYRVHVPESYDGSVSVPLVLDFHGYSSDGLQQIVLSQMNAKSDTEGFIAIHPEGSGILKSWNAGACCGTAADMNLDDVGLVRAIIADVSTRVCIDPSRVYATGMSNGGFLSHRLGCEAADVIAAIAPVAGVLGIDDADCTPSRPMPVMDFHGTTDVVVPYEGSDILGFRSVAETIDSWVARDGCDASPAVSYMMGDTTCETWSGCDDGVEVTLCTSTGEGHWWPGGTASTADIVATDAMWEFFTRNRLR
jgi:polyhydroxybutyrate depolymerase